MTSTANEKKMYTKDEMEGQLAMQGLTLGLKTVTDGIATLQKTVQDAAEKGEREFREVLSELKREEEKRVQDKNEIREEMFEKFIQKKDLKIYLSIIIVVISVTTGGIQWAMGVSTAAKNDLSRELDRELVIERLESTLQAHGLSPSPRGK